MRVVARGYVARCSNCVFLTPADGLRDNNRLLVRLGELHNRISSPSNDWVFESSQHCRTSGVGRSAEHQPGGTLPIKVVALTRPPKSQRAPLRLLSYSHSVSPASHFLLSVTTYSVPPFLQRSHRPLLQPSSSTPGRLRPFLACISRGRCSRT